MADEERKKLLFMATIAEKTARYRDAAKFMEAIVHNYITAADGGGELTAEERDLLEAAYKNLADPLRKAWRIVASLKNHKEATVLYKSNIERELSDLCSRVLDNLGDYLIPSARKFDSKVFYLKMKGDYYRYLAGIKSDDEKTKAVNSANLAYIAASNIALAKLRPSDPLRIRLSFNMATFCYEFYKEGETEIARSFARHVFREAWDDAENASLSEEQRKESIKVLELFRETLYYWESSDIQVAGNKFSTMSL